MTEGTDMKNEKAKIGNRILCTIEFRLIYSTEQDV